MTALDKDILAYELFACDRDSDVTVFRNKMLVTRKHHSCVICLDDIAAGARVRAQTELDRDCGVVMTFYVCGRCCAACAAAMCDPLDAGKAIEKRTLIGIEKSRRADGEIEWAADFSVEEGAF